MSARKIRNLKQLLIAEINIILIVIGQPRKLFEASIPCKKTTLNIMPVISKGLGRGVSNSTSTFHFTCLSSPKVR